MLAARRAATGLMDWGAPCRCCVTTAVQGVRHGLESFQKVPVAGGRAGLPKEVTLEEQDGTSYMLSCVKRI